TVTEWSVGGDLECGGLRRFGTFFFAPGSRLSPACVHTEEKKKKDPKRRRPPHSKTPPLAMLELLSSSFRRGRSIAWQAAVQELFLSGRGSGNACRGPSRQRATPPGSA